MPAPGDNFNSFVLLNVSLSSDELAAGFQRIPNKRVLPDYFTVIQTPVAFSTIRVCQTITKTIGARFQLSLLFRIL